jgi:hypothetical protein
MPTIDPTQAFAALDRARRLSRVLDTAIALPGTSFRFGLDPIIGLVPGFGDAIGFALSAYIIIVASRVGVPRRVLWRMLLNVAIDAVIGAIPVAGDLFDFAWHANARNVRLFERAISRAAQPA